MQLIELIIDGFGVWRRLDLGPLAEGLNVFYGPNEAGKTTLMQFVRCVLYGFSDERRQRYLPPLEGDSARGSVKLQFRGRVYTVMRTLDPAVPGPGEVSIVDQDGRPADPSLLPELLGDVDEAVFQNVFALGLGELQKLATLDDTEAADHLYQLAAGVDHVSLVDVLARLRTAADRLYNAADHTGELPRLCDRRDALDAQIAQHQQAIELYLNTRVERDEIDRRVAETEQLAARQAAELRTLELATDVRDLWHERTEVTSHANALGHVDDVPAEAPERLAEISRRLDTYRQRAKRYRTRMRTARKAARKIELNTHLLAHAPRIEVFTQWQSWLAAMAGRVRNAAGEVQRLEEQLADCREQAGLDADDELPQLSDRTLTALAPIIRTAKKAKRRAAEAQAERAQAEQLAADLAAELEQGMAGREESDALAAAEETGHTVSKLRRRRQLIERLEQLERQRGELAAQGHQLLEQQQLPAWVLWALGGLFVLGVMFVLGGFLLPLITGGELHWAFAVLGVGGMGTAAVVKMQMEKAQVTRLEASQRQGEMVETQILQAREELRQIEAQFPQSPSPDERLAAAEAELARLEKLLPLDARRKSALADAKAAERRLADADADEQAARGRWRKQIKRLGLPPDLRPAAVRKLVEMSQQITANTRQLQTAREELGREREAFDQLVEQIEQLLTDVHFEPEADDPIEALAQLATALRAATAAADRRAKLKQRWRTARKRHRQASQSVVRWKRRRRSLLARYGARDEESLVARAGRSAEATRCRQRLETITAQIRTRLGKHADEDAIAALLAKHPGTELAARCEQASFDALATQSELKQLCQEQGRLNEKLTRLADDRRLGDLQVELGEVETQLAETARQWLVLATTAQLLEHLCHEYERTRQPETLQEASRYLERLTDGRYPRVWTRLQDRVLVVDDADGRPLPVEVLSRGTREQLFLCLRLALGTWYARHGAALPLVLDDLFVNFDARRSLAAARVLRDYARKHQVLFFTCHEHIAALFGDLSVDVHHLPHRAGIDPPLVLIEDPGDQIPIAPSSTLSRRAATPAEPEVLVPSVPLRDVVAQLEDDDGPLASDLIQAEEDVDDSQDLSAAA